MRFSSLLLVPISLCLAACGSDEGAPPDWIVPREEAPPLDLRLTGERESHDFGEVYPDSIHVTEFDLVAEGSEPVVVEKMVRSCGCTEGELYWIDEGGKRSAIELKREYPPGSRFVLVATLNTQGKVGTQEQRVQIVLRGVQEPFDRVLHAEIRPFLEFEPALADLGTFRTFEARSTRVHVASATGERFRVTGISAAQAGDDFRFEPEAPDAEGRAASGWLSFDLAPGRKIGRLGATVVVTTDAPNPQADGRTHRASLLLGGLVEPAVETTPDRLGFGRLTPGVRSVRKLLVRSYDPEFSLESFGVRIDEGSLEGASAAFAEAFSIEATELEEGRAWELEIAVEDVPGEGSVQGALTLAVGHPFQEEMRVPLSLQLPPGS